MSVMAGEPSSLPLQASRLLLIHVSESKPPREVCKHSGRFVTRKGGEDTAPLPWGEGKSEPLLVTDLIERLGVIYLI